MNTFEIQQANAIFCSALEKWNSATEKNRPFLIKRAIHAIEWNIHMSDESSKILIRSAIMFTKHLRKTGRTVFADLLHDRITALPF